MLINKKLNSLVDLFLLYFDITIVTKSFSSSKSQSEFTIKRKEFLLESSCRLCAKQCFLFSPSSAVPNHFQDETLNVNAISVHFLTRHDTQQIPNTSASQAKSNARTAYFNNQRPPLTRQCHDIEDEYQIHCKSS